MSGDAKRRIRGRGDVPARDTKPRTPSREGVAKLPLLVVISACLHALVLAAAVYLPGLIPWHEKPVKLFTVTMTNLPPGPKGGGGSEPTPVKPPPKPVKEPEPKKPEPEPVKIAKPVPEKPRPEPAKEPAKTSPKEPAKEPVPVPEPAKPKAPAGPGQGPMGGGKEGTKPEGPVVFEGGEGIDLGPYRADIERKVGGNWRPPKIVSRKKPKVTIAFRIDRRGRIRDIKVEIPSGTPMIDRLAQSAVTEANPLPPLPSELGLDSLVVHYTFEVSD